MKMTNKMFKTVIKLLVAAATITISTTIWQKFGTKFRLGAHISLI